MVSDCEYVLKKSPLLIQEMIQIVSQLVMLASAGRGEQGLWFYCSVVCTTSWHITHWSPYLVFLLPAPFNSDPEPGIEPQIL